MSGDVYYLGPCDNEREPDGEPCTGELYAHRGDAQVRCPVCGGWVGVLAPGLLPVGADTDWWWTGE